MDIVLVTVQRILYSFVLIEKYFYLLYVEKYLNDTKN